MICAIGPRRLWGSPAHAGIDPQKSRDLLALCGLPRTRGDRPVVPDRASAVMPAPPHTRGSTLNEQIVSIIGAGSPAHAGIDLCACTARKTPCWLPRTRGDRPAVIVVVPVMVMAPPHTRGSTPITCLDPHHPGGSPAHAGIDPPDRRQKHRPTRLPRTRGDRPGGSVVGGGAGGAPPHTRGSTPCRRHRRPLRCGSPAHAGIDLPCLVSASCEAGLPRTRGDRPRQPGNSGSPDRAPPHTRGSTPNPA